MDLFIPAITVQPINVVKAIDAVNDSIDSINNYNSINVPSNNEFQKVYFEELARKCYEDNGNFNAISNMARIHYEEYYGIGSIPLKRWKIYFSKYNILVNIEDNNGKLQIKAA